MKSGEKTKTKMAEAFKQLMVQRSFDSITITDITDACGLNRLTFYYHFQDKYDLMDWIFYKDVIAPLEGKVNADNWSVMLLSALQVLKDDSDYYCSSVSYDRVELRRYILDVSSGIMKDMMADISEATDIDPEDRAFQVEFYSHGLAGIMFKWILSGMKEEPVVLMRQIESVLNSLEIRSVDR